MSATQPLRVMIVDDEAPARNRLRDLLGDCALKMPLEIAGEADNGRRALELLPELRADVVLLDIRMPEIDGIEVAQVISEEIAVALGHFGEAETTPVERHDGTLGPPRPLPQFVDHELEGRGHVHPAVREHQRGQGAVVWAPLEQVVAASPQ